jgi:hypothetical protein
VWCLGWIQDLNFIRKNNIDYKIIVYSQAWWGMNVIPATPEAEEGGWQEWAQFGQHKETLPPKTQNQNQTKLIA